MKASGLLYGALGNLTDNQLGFWLRGVSISYEHFVHFICLLCLTSRTSLLSTPTLFLHQRPGLSALCVCCCDSLLSQANLTTHLVCRCPSTYFHNSLQNTRVRAKTLAFRLPVRDVQTQLSTVTSTARRIFVTF